MIFVTIGNATQSFERLLRAVDDLARDGVFGKSQIFMQSGNTQFQAQACQQQAFMGADEFSATLRDAEVVVTHAGAGTLLQSIVCGKLPVVVPRQASHAEHIDDHQVELARRLEQEGKIIAVWDLANLSKAIAEARVRKPQRVSGAPRMVTLVAECLNEIASRSKSK
jgi:UDP-N-acetylglucosamine transferase subunit ALG13